MADSWIKMRVGLRRHPKVVRIVSALKADRLRVVGALHAVWSVFDEHSVDGVLPGYSFEMMDEEIAWPGFSQAMGGVGWLERDGDCGLVMPRFNTHNGQSAKRRAQESVRKSESREAVRSLSADDADKKRPRKDKKRTTSLREVGASRAARLAHEWVLPDGWRAWALQEHPTWDAQHVVKVSLNFRDYWTAKAGKDAAKLDWERTWQTWVRKEGPKVGPRGVAAVASAKWRPGSEPDDVLRKAAGLVQIEPWQQGETHGQFRQRIVDAGGEKYLLPPKAA